MKILIACEESQEVCKAFRAKGHEAYSCDILPCSGGHPEWHFECDIQHALSDEWDMLIAFPPCTHLAVSGTKHFAKKQADGRQQYAIDFFMKFAECSIARVAIENPIGIMSTQWRKPDQIIQPYEHGHSVNKSTCLWLKGLPLLVPTNMVPSDDIITLSSGAKMSKWYYETSCLPQKERATARSKTFAGIAKAMADKWG